MNEDKELYPSLEDYPHSGSPFTPSAPGHYGETLLRETYEEKHLKKKLAELRLKDFENDLRWLCEKINHYKKLDRRWKHVDSGVRYNDIVVGTAIGLGGAVVLGLGSMGILTSVILTSCLISIPIINGIAHGVLNVSLFKGRILKYTKIIKELEDSKNKLFLFHQKALKDEILTDEEIQVSKDMIEEIKDKIIKIGEQHALEGGIKKNPNHNGDILKELEELKKKVCAEDKPFGKSA